MQRALKSLLAVATLFVADCLYSAHFPPLTHSSLQGLHFSDGCAQKEWSATPENSMTVILSAFPGQDCVAQLNLETPVFMDGITGFEFESRGSARGQLYGFEFLENVGDTAGTVTPNFRADSRWHVDSLVFRHLKKDWESRQVAAIRLVAFSLPAAHGRTIFPLYVRNMQFRNQEGVAELPPARRGSITDTSAANSMMNVPRPSSIVNRSTRGLRGTLTPNHAPHVTSPISSSPFHQRLWEKCLAGVFLIGMASSLLRRRRSSKSDFGSMSPLYEMNTRTWHSRRDPEGVLHVGGLNRITLTDLQDIKEMGFHSLWLMGLWDVGDKVRAISKRYGADYQGSPYAINEYCVADDLGTEEALIILVAHARSVGLRVIVDFVPNHMGLDSAWLNDHPEFFIHKLLTDAEALLPDEELQKIYPHYFPYRTPSYPQDGRRVPKTIMVAYGRDPYFYPWIDTAQLDYAQPALRRKMTDVLTHLSRLVDGVRCDMAMLVLREQVKTHRHPEMSWDAFNQSMPEEFWPEAIRVVKRMNPSFVFIAETYWSMEGYLQTLGFDYTYNKPLYEAVCNAFHSGHAEALMNLLRLLGSDFLKHGVHFLENHDEERAMNALGEERQRGAAALLCTLPGIALIHQGQMEGRRERLPVQRVVPIENERTNSGLRQYYEGLLRATNLSVFRNGTMQPLYGNNPALISFARIEGNTKAIVIINTSDHQQKGSVYLSPGMHLQTGPPYRLHDLYYKLKTDEVRHQSTVRPSYLYSAAPLINYGLYVELFAFDVHIFLLERQAGRSIAARLRHLFYPPEESRLNARQVAPLSPPAIPIDSPPLIPEPAFKS